MRLTSFRARGFRSLRDVEISELRPFSIFYGRNGAGKSNVLAAVQTLFQLLEVRTRPDQPWLMEMMDRPWFVPKENRLDRRNRNRDMKNHQLRLGARVELKDEELLKLTVELSYDWNRHTLTIESARGDRRDGSVVGHHRPELQSLLHQVATECFSMVDAVRSPRAESGQTTGKDVSQLLHEGQLAHALLGAQHHGDRRIRKRYQQLREVLRGEPFCRPPFDIITDARTGSVEIIESHDDGDVPLELAGLGIAQVYAIVAHILLAGTRVVAIEEPEAHLHSPSSGLSLRMLLERMVNEHYIDQLFIATHSNLFDLDPEFYFDVALDLDDERGTIVARKPVHEIDNAHLYEPGPAKRALEHSLRYLDRDEVVFRQSDGTPVSAGAMLDMLRRDDRQALEFLRDVHGAAVRAVRVKSEKAPSS